VSTRYRYPHEFKDKAIALALSSDRPKTETARSLGFPDWSCPGRMVALLFRRCDMRACGYLLPCPRCERNFAMCSFPGELELRLISNSCTFSPR
jgi:hypothetical protein